MALNGSEGVETTDDFGAGEEDKGTAEGYDERSTVDESDGGGGGEVVVADVTDEEADDGGATAIEMDDNAAVDESDGEGDAVVVDDTDEGADDVDDREPRFLVVVETTVVVSTTVSPSGVISEVFLLSETFVSTVGGRRLSTTTGASSWTTSNFTLAVGGKEGTSLEATMSTLVSEEVVDVDGVEIADVTSVDFCFSTLISVGVIDASVADNSLDLRFSVFVSMGLSVDETEKRLGAGDELSSTLISSALITSSNSPEFATP